MPKEEWKKVEAAKIWLPEEEDDQIQGEVASKLEGQFGLQLVIKTADGEVMTPSHKVLQNRLATAKPGDVVRIVFVGKEKSKTKGRQDMSMYEVYFRQ